MLDNQHRALRQQMRTLKWIWTILKIQLVLFQILLVFVKLMMILG